MRLSANFVNLEVTVTGVPNLRIPTTLLREKQRTAKRFSVCVQIPTTPYEFSLTHGVFAEQRVHL